MIKYNKRNHNIYSDLFTLLLNLRLMFFFIFVWFKVHRKLTLISFNLKRIFQSRNKKTKVENKQKIRMEYVGMCQYTQCKVHSIHFHTHHHHKNDVIC